MSQKTIPPFDTDQFDDIDLKTVLALNGLPESHFEWVKTDPRFKHYRNHARTIREMRLALYGK